MRRFMLLIAMVFAFAAVTGGARGLTHAYSSVPVVAAQSSTLCGETEQTVSVLFKLCGKTQSGVVLPCHHIATLPNAVAPLPPFRAECRVGGLTTSLETTPFTAPLLRPPIAA